MSQLVETGQGLAEFPDEMSHDEITGVIKKQFYSPENPPPVEIGVPEGALPNAAALKAGVIQSEGVAPPVLQNLSGAIEETVAGIPQFAAKLPQFALQGTKLAQGTLSEKLGALSFLGSEAVPMGRQMSSDIEAPLGSKESFRGFLQAGMMAVPGLELAREIRAGSLQAKLAPITDEVPKVEAPPVQEAVQAPATPVIPESSVLEAEKAAAKPETLTPQEQVSQETGKPLSVVAYHGSRGTSGDLDTTFRGLGTEAKSAKDAFFFTSDRQLAQDYADMALPKDVLEARKQINLLEDEKQKLTEQFSIELPAQQQDAMHQRYAEIESSLPTLRAKVGEYLLERGRREELGGLTGDKSANVFEKLLTFQNPLVVDFSGKPFREQTYASFIEQAKNQGRDGVVFKNTFDPASGYREQRPTTIYAAIRPEGISDYKALPATTSQTQIPSETRSNPKPVPEAVQTPAESGLGAEAQKLPENTEVTIKASTSKGEPLEVKMDAREAEKVLNERKTSLEKLIDCLGA